MAERRQINVRVSEQTEREIAALCESLGVSLSDVVRLAVRTMHRQELELRQPGKNGRKSRKSLDSV